MLKDKLHEVAEALYSAEATDEVFKNTFTKVELVALWEGHCVYRQDEQGKLIGGDAPYDDEVYGALDRLGYWDNK